MSLADVGGELLCCKMTMSLGGMFRGEVTGGGILCFKMATLLGETSLADIVGGDDAP